MKMRMATLLGFVSAVAGADVSIGVGDDIVTSIDGVRE